MSERNVDDPTLPPPGQRCGEGSTSILPYLIKTLATRPQPAAEMGPPKPAAMQPPPPAPRPS
jgi:hypothetical protein